jgi:hypothetical protein
MVAVEKSLAVGIPEVLLRPIPSAIPAIGRPVAPVPPRIVPVTTARVLESFLVTVCAAAFVRGVVVAVAVRPRLLGVRP